MQTTLDNKQITTIYVIVNRGLGSKVLHIARQSGLPGGTVFLGKGTFDNQFLKALALNDTHKEIVLLVAEEFAAEKFLNILNESMKFSKPNHGIAFLERVECVCGSIPLGGSRDSYEGKEERTVYQSVYVIVDKGKGETAAEMAYQAGATGATIINARGSGIHETSKLFNMEIEPEKEIVMIIIKKEITQQVVDSIRSGLKLDEPGNGIVFIQNIQQVYGLYE